MDKNLIQNKFNQNKNNLKVDLLEMHMVKLKLMIFLILKKLVNIYFNNLDI
jgi:hypothetical protein